MLGVETNVFNVFRPHRLEGPKTDVQSNGLDLDASSANGIKNLRGKVKASGGRGCTAWLVRKDSLVAVAIFFPIVTVNVRRQRHVTNPVENREEVRRRNKANCPFTEFSGGDNLGLQERLFFAGCSEMKMLAGLNLATGANERRPLVFVELLSEKNLDAACGVGRAGLRVETACASGVEACGDNAAVVENEQVAGVEQVRQIAEKVVTIFSGLTIEDEHTAGPTDRRRRLSDKVFGKIEMKVGYTHCLILVRQATLRFAGLGQLDGVVENGLNSRLLGGDLGCPGDSNARERFGNEETVPGANFPCLLGVDVEGAYGGTDEFGQLGNAGLGDLGGATRAVGGNSAVVAGEVGALKVAEAAGAVAGAGASNGNEAQALYGAGNEFAVEASADENSDAIVAETPGTSEETTMPEGVDCRRRRVVTRKGSGIANVSVAEGYAEAANGHARQAGDNGEGDALLQSEGLGHEDEFTVTATGDVPLI